MPVGRGSLSATSMICVGVIMKSTGTSCSLNKCSGNSSRTCNTTQKIKTDQKQNFEASLSHKIERGPGRVDQVVQLTKLFRVIKEIVSET